MSEGRSITNLIGNAIATLVIAKSEKQFDEKQFETEVELQ
jgi:aerobic C4-dicarboxylate transport protein